MDVHYSMITDVAVFAQYEATKISAPYLSLSRLRPIGTRLVAWDTTVILLTTPTGIKRIGEAYITCFLTNVIVHIVVFN